ncbi:zinc finger protein 521 isoform X2 [Oncorhynchus masou masou]
MEIPSEDIVIRETLGAEVEVEILEDVIKAHKQNPPEIPRFSVPRPFSMPEDSSDDDCDLSGNSISTYGMHFMELGGKCWECGVQFRSGQELIEHFESHRSKVSTSCNICRVTFSRTVSLAMHLVNAHSNSVLHCSNCQLHFSNLWDLNKHIGIHLFTELLNTPLGDISNNVLNSSEETLKGQYTLPSALALKHDDNSNDGLNGREETLKGQHTVPSVVALDHEDTSNDGLNGREETLNAQCTPPSVVTRDHTYSMESNGRVSKTRHRLEESEEGEDVKPDPSTLTPSLRIRVKLERGVEVDCAPLQWDEGMNDGEGGEYSKDTESAGGTDNNRLTESSGETDIDEEDIRLSEEEEEIKSKQGEDRNNDIHSEEEDEDAETLIDQEGEPSSSERESEFDPEELSDSDSRSSSTGESSGSSYTPVRTRNAKTRPSRTTQHKTKLSQVKPYYCIYCAKGPYHNMDFHVKTCNMKKDFQCSLCQAVFPTEMAMLDHQVRTHSEAISGQMYACEFCRQVFPDLAIYKNHNCPKKDTPPPYVPDPTTCIYCGTGPFINMDVHLRGCSWKGLTCTECRVLFHNRKALQNHNVSVHGQLSTMCAVCGRGPFTDMDFHLRSCSRDWSFQCSECKVQFPSEKSLVDHNLKYHSATSKTSDQGVCVYCGSGPFTSLDIHMRTCSKQKGLKCSVCKVFFPTESVLADHMVCYHSTPYHVHSTPYQVQSIPYQVQSTDSETPEGTCLYCGRGPFTNLDNHMKTCSKRKCIQCSVCKLFFTSDVLANHMISYHSTKFRVQSPVTEMPDNGACVRCGRGPFTSLEHHMKYCNKQKGIQCVMCKAYFLTEGSLVDHIVLAHADKLVTQAGGSSATTFSFVPMTISTTSGQQSPSSSTLMCCSSGNKELKRLAPVPVSDQGHCAVGQLTPAGQSVSLPRVMLSTTTSSQPAIPVVATLLIDNTGGGPAKIARLVPVAPQTNPPKTQVTAPTHTNTAKPLGQFSNLLQQTVHQEKSVQQQTPRPTALAMDPIRSPTTPSPRPASASAPGKITMIHLSPVHTPPLAQSSPLTLAFAPAPLSIMCMFVNRSKELALEKRMKMSWRSKCTYTCRQCGAVSQQPSLSVKHRYLHRGSRRYRCHCGRSFLRRLHLLRHYLQHAQATRYICTACGETFDGAKCLAQHMVGASNTTRCPGDSITLKLRKECRMPFSCHCGQVFCRPAAFLWHKLKNTQRT